MSEDRKLPPSAMRIIVTNGVDGPPVGWLEGMYLDERGVIRVSVKIDEPGVVLDLSRGREQVRDAVRTLHNALGYLGYADSGMPVINTVTTEYPNSYWKELL